MTTLMLERRPAKISRDDFGTWLDLMFRNEVKRFAEEIPRAGQLTDASTPFDERYYIRHRIETVHRIRSTSALDAYALSMMVSEDYEAARPWGEYIVEELQHDRLYLADLARHGVSLDDVLATPRFPSTDRLLESIRQRLDAIGSIAAVAYSLFVEWNSERYSAAAVTKAELSLGAEYVRGSKAHLGIDESEDHYSVMVSVAHRLLPRLKSIHVLGDWLLEISRCFREYFQELHEATT